MIKGAKDEGEVLQILIQHYIDAAEKEKSFTKETALLRNAWGDFEKTIGQAVIPTLVKLLETMNDGIKNLSTWKGFLKTAATETAEFTASLFVGKPAVDALGASLDKIQQTTFGDKVAEQSAKANDALVKKTGAKIDTRINADEIAAEEKAAREKADKARETWDKRVQREVEGNAKRQAAEMDADAKLEAMEQDINLKMQGMGADTLDKKLKYIQAEADAEADAVRKSVASADMKKRAIDAINAKATAQKTEETKKQSKFETDTALQVAATSIEALQQINSMSELKSKNDARRAKMLLALEQAITIARVWREAAGTGPWGLALAAAQTALVVAQFSAQSKAIDRAQREAGQGANTMTMNTTEIGGGTSIVTTNGNIPVGVSTGTSGAPSGGGGITTINVGGVTVHFQTDHVDLSEVDAIARRLADYVLQGTVNGVQLALAVQNTADKNSGLAV
jgi:hypothetical protein